MSGTRSSPDICVPAVSVTEAMNGSFLIVDVRSPAESAEGSVPGAVSAPLLDDLQRAVVGTTYKERGARQARMAAMEAVSAGLPDYLGGLSKLALEQARGRRLAIMCWRGGERSRNVVLLLALIGVHAVQVTGGYKAYRRTVVEGLGGWLPDRPVVTLHGMTGSGKTELIRALAHERVGRGPRPWAVDLEGLALHRGSLLGGLNQPGRRTQRDFEGLLWQTLERPSGDYLVLEGEGAKVGALYLPESVIGAIRSGTPVLIAASVEERADRILAEYSPAEWMSEDRQHFRIALGKIGRRMPVEARRSLEASFEDGRFADTVRALLVEYYDPLYQRSSVDGKDFVLRFRTSADPEADAQRFMTTMARILGR